VAHCKKLNHEFNTLEMAVIITKNNKTLKEKHEAWAVICELENFSDDER